MRKRLTSKQKLVLKRAYEYHKQDRKINNKWPETYLSFHRKLDPKSWRFRAVIMPLILFVDFLERKFNIKVE